MDHTAIKSRDAQGFSLSGADDVRVISFACKDFLNTIREMFDWQCIVVWIKRGLIPAFAKICAIVKIDVAFVGVSFVLITADMMPKIQHLKIAMLFNDPSALLRTNGRKIEAAYSS